MHRGVFCSETECNTLEMLEEYKKTVKKNVNILKIFMCLVTTSDQIVHQHNILQHT